MRRASRRARDGRPPELRGIERRALAVEAQPLGGHVESIAQQLRHRFGIEHATIQIELADTDEACALTPEHVV